MCFVCEGEIFFVCDFGDGIVGSEVIFENVNVFIVFDRIFKGLDNLLFRV